KVYILPMAGGFDQYLAEQLARDHVVQVVADPKLADSVLTERLGETFEQKMAKIHPRDEKKDDQKTDDLHPGFRSSAAKGTVFLVDANTRQVLWSDYEKPPHSRSGGSLNHAAAKIAKKLEAALGK
ncbi:MAG TPA: hypothetical protein VHB50_06910, partial [Bryobacteraceae bacterium]|nr:hypothetical protein [Bryobacteraceae bacterium]